MAHLRPTSAVRPLLTGRDDPFRSTRQPALKVRRAAGSLFRPHSEHSSRDPADRAARVQVDRDLRHAGPDVLLTRGKAEPHQ
jgi:hypothetical protein